MFGPKKADSGIHQQANSPDEWLALCARYRDASRLLLEAKQTDMCWLNSGFAVECCLKAAIMKKERMNRWPDKDDAPDLWTHDLRDLFRRLGIDPAAFDHKNPVAPSLKVVLDWRRQHGYSVGKTPLKFARDIFAAAFDGGGVVEWIARLYQLHI